MAAGVYESLAAEGVPNRPQRGPKRLLCLDDLTTVVKPAYLTGGRKPVVAVRKAMSKHRGQPVTMDQARKAVVRAREAGVLPPAGGRGKPSSTTAPAAGEGGISEYKTKAGPRYLIKYRAPLRDGPAWSCAAAS